jgi:hypothetical protein
MTHRLCRDTAERYFISKAKHKEAFNQFIDLGDEESIKAEDKLRELKRFHLSEVQQHWEDLKIKKGIKCSTM